MKIFFTLFCAIAASFFLIIGLKVVSKKRPLILSSRFFFAFMVLAFLPQFINSARMLTQTDSGSLSLILWINPIMFIVLLAFFWIQMKGYMLIGIYDDSFRDALHFSLNKNNFPFEERLSVVALTEHNADLQVAIQSWIGAGQLKLKKSKDQTVLKSIVDGINEYYKNEEVKPNNITSVFYIIMGIFMLVLGGVCLFAF